MMLQKRRKSQKRRFRIKCVLVAGLLLLGVFAVDMRLRPAVESVARGQASLYASQAIQDTIYEEISLLELQYGDMVRLTYSDQGTVTSLQTDMLAMSKLQSSVTTSIIRRILKFEEQRVVLPLGSFTGSPILSGRGPEVEIRLIPASFIKTQIRNQFDSAGINQTRHQIVMNVQLDIQAVLPGYSISSKVDTDVCLAETVIVGMPPNAFTLVGDGTDQLAGIIQDYGAGEQP